MSEMNTMIRILHVEDNLNDAELVRATLAEGGVVCDMERVETRPAFLAKLEEGGFDLILSDFSMPSFDGFTALLLAREKCPDTPFIFVSGTIGEDRAIETFKSGATDYVLKDKLTRLVPAVRRALREAEERRELARMQKARDAFGQFVTPEVADYVLAHPDDFWQRGERRVVTIMFVDVRGFTAFSSRVQPEEAVSVLNEIFAPVIAAVQDHGGILNKFMGDGLMALFGVPVPTTDHAQGAARAALQARDAVEALAGARRARGLDPLRIGIGLNTGEVVAGCVGTKERAEYSVIGTAVNLASRLEKTAAPGQILLGPDTGRALRGAFELSGTIALKIEGLPEPVPVTELIGEKERKSC